MTVDNLGALLAVALAVATLGLLAWFLRYRLRLSAVTETLIDAEDALDQGDVERARTLTAPILAKYPQLPIVQDVAADVLYASGDPLSAASHCSRWARSPTRGRPGRWRSMPHPTRSARLSRVASGATFPPNDGPSTAPCAVLPAAQPMWTTALVLPAPPSTVIV